MSTSKALADRTMLDIRGINLSLRHAIVALETGKEPLLSKGKELLSAIKEDIDSMGNDHVMADSLDAYYNFSIDEQTNLIHGVLHKIEEGAFPEANRQLELLVKKTEEKLGEHLREGVS